MQLLLGKAKDKDTKEKNKQTALHLAASLGKRNVVEELLKNAANADAEDMEKGSPLHLAVMGDGKENSEILELLLAGMKKKNAKDSRGQTALHLAASHGSTRHSNRC